MSLERLRGNDRLRDRLASEYVLGTLRGGARRRFDTWLLEDSLLQRAVTEWQNRLMPMAEMVPPAEASPQVWRAIDRRLALSASGAKAVERGAAPSRPAWRDSLRFWRALGVASTAAASLLTAVLLARMPAQEAPFAAHIAMLTDGASRPVVLVRSDAARRRLLVKVVAPQAVAAGKSLELWAVPQAGAPQSLGLVPDSGAVTLQIPAGTAADAMLRAAPLLAISLEPKGGSPDPRKPSGPILFKGSWLEI